MEQNEIRKLQSEEGFKEIFHKYYPGLKTYAMLYLPDESIAEDILQEIFLHLWTNRKKRKPTDNLRSYLYKAVYNRCMKHIKHVKINYNFIKERSLDQEIEYILHSNFSPAQGAFNDKTLREELNKAIRSLPDACKQSFVLSRRFKLKNKEVAEFMNISVKAVEKNLTRAMKLLRENLSESYKNLFK